MEIILIYLLWLLMLGWRSGSITHLNVPLEDTSKNLIHCCLTPESVWAFFSSLHVLMFHYLLEINRRDNGMRRMSNNGLHKSALASRDRSVRLRFALHVFDTCTTSAEQKIRLYVSRNCFSLFQVLSFRLFMKYPSYHITIIDFFTRIDLFSNFVKTPSNICRFARKLPRLRK